MQEVIDKLDSALRQPTRSPSPVGREKSIEKQDRQAEKRSRSSSGERSNKKKKKKKPKVRTI